MRVLLVEDDCVTADLLAANLREFGYEVTVAGDGREAFERIRTGRYRLVVSDWEMPAMSGTELCRQIRRRASSGYIYVILATSYGDVAHVVQGLEAGADDFLTKPVRPEELRVRLRAGERLLALEGRDLMIFALAKLAESRDPDTGAHLERIREYCRILAEELSEQPKHQGHVDGEYVQLIYLTSPLHDIGKVGVPDSVLLKPGRLDPQEYEIIKTHTVLGGQTLDAAAQAHPEAQFLAMARDIALSHHERFDGRGYPRGLSGDEIPLSGRITALADVYDALTSKRVYKSAYKHDIARSIIQEETGSHFDPNVVEAFLATEQEFVKVAQQYDDVPAAA